MTPAPAPGAGAALPGPPVRRAAALRGRASLLAGLLLALCAAAPAAAQSDGSPAAELGALEAAVDSGRVEAAREELDRWMEDHLSGASTDLRARARLLQARLSEDPEAARRAYALVAVDGGPAGARARLRLAQLHLAEGRLQQALEELEMLRADVPGAVLTAEAWLWTGRVRQARGEPDAACGAFRRAVAGAPVGHDELRRRASAALEACRGAAPAAAGGDTASPPGGTEEGTDGRRRYTVQLGAFSTLEAARRMRDRAREAGFDARVTPPRPGDGLRRVQVGRFDREAAAEETARRIEERDLRAIVVEVEASGDEP